MADEPEILNALFAAASRAESLPEDQRLGRDAGGGWEAFLALLAEETRAEGAALFLTQQDQIEHGWQVGAAPNPPEEILRMRTSRVYSQVDLPGLWQRDSPIRATRCNVGADRSVLLMLQRRGEDFRAIDGSQLSTLTPYLGPALSTWLRLGQERNRAQRDRDLLRDLGGGWLVFSTTGAVQEASEGAAELLAGHAGWRIASDGRITFREPAQGSALLQVLQGARPGQPPAVLRLADEPVTELLVSAEETGAGRVLLGRLRQAPSAARLAPERLAAHCGISLSEARLVQLLCDGMSIADAAARLGWTLETTRSTSKRIFARMEVTGQTGVLRRVLGGAVWLGAERRN